MTFKVFYNKHNGQYIDIDGVAGVQCVDLVKLGMKEMFDIPYFSFGGSAKNLWEKYDSIPQLKKNFDRIPNTPDYVPKEADILVWNGNVGKGDGHCAWGMGEGDTNQFYSFDQNWSGKAAHKQKHSYKNLYGALRRKKQSGTGKDTAKDKSSSFPVYEGNSHSIVEALCKVKAGTSYAYRKQIAVANGIENYRGSLEQNAELVRLIKEGKLKRP